MTLVSTHFKRAEFACHCGCGFDAADTELVGVLEDLREHFGRPVKILSGCRCREHNTRVGGSPKSQHVFAKATDVVVSATAPSIVADYLESKYQDTYGIGRYHSWVHIDVRDQKSRWNNSGVNA